MAKLQLKSLEHEGIQVGYLITCPSCKADIRVPVFEFLSDHAAAAWSVPPQNTALAAGGWYHAWNTRDSESGLSLLQPLPARGEPIPGGPHTLVCESCGNGFTVENGKITLAG